MKLHNYRSEHTRPNPINIIKLDIHNRYHVLEDFIMSYVYDIS